MNIYLTGDTHRNFKRILFFCLDNKTSTEDIMVILKDAGINLLLNEYDHRIKKELNNVPITLFCIHGNHEERPFNVSGYEEVDYVFSHTCPYNVMPRHLFLYGIDQRKVDNSTEKWLMREVASKLHFKRWYFGHFHDYWEKDQYTMLYNDIIKFE